MQGWIGVDLDGTLAEYSGWKGAGSIGAPIPAMVERVKQWLSEGKDVRIFTARMWHDGTAARLGDAVDAVLAIRDWCATHIGTVLPITCTKDYGMVELWDDRAVHNHTPGPGCADCREKATPSLEKSAVLPKIHFRLGAEWVAMYFNGKKAAEGHTLNERDVLHALGIPYTTKLVSCDPDDTENPVTGFPKELPPCS